MIYTIHNRRRVSIDYSFDFAFSTSCGSVNYFSNQNPIVETNVFVEFSPWSELHNEAVSVPVKYFNIEMLGFNDI